MTPLFSQRSDLGDFDNHGISHAASSELLTRAERYLSALPPSIQGQGGGAALYKACSVLIRGFALDLEIAFLLLKRWNLEMAQPPWSEQDLWRTLKSASRSSLPLGYLLDQNSDDRWVHGPRFKDDEECRKAGLRQRWPSIRALHADEMRQVADLRSIPVEAVQLGCSLGVIGAAVVDGHPCFVLREGSFAQARKLDGMPFHLKDGTVTKAKNLPGSHGAFLGTRWIGNLASILLVEGCVTWLEAVAAIWLADRTDWTVLAATSASSRFSRDPVLLKTLAGRKVRIVPDGDQAGCQAAASWLADLDSVGCRTDAFSLPGGAKDIGCLIRQDSEPAQPLKSLFV